MTALLVLLVAIAALLVALSGSSTRVLREYESAVVFRLGRLLEQEGPGLTFLIPVIDSMVCVAEKCDDGPTSDERGARSVARWPPHGRTSTRSASSCASASVSRRRRG